MNTNEFEGLIADGPFFAPSWGYIWDVVNYPDEYTIESSRVNYVPLFMDFQS